MPFPSNNYFRDKVEELLNTMGIQNVIIQRCHRVGPKSRAPPSATQGPPAPFTQPTTPAAKPRQILVQFTGQMDKLRVMRKSKELQSTRPSVFINEDLTRYRAHLLFFAHQKKKDRALQGAWSSDGRIICKNNKGRIYHVSSEADINKVIEECRSTGSS